MANQNIDTTAPGYQTRLTQIQEIKAFYGSTIVAYLQETPERQQQWRQADPMLWELLDIWYKIEERTTEDYSD